MDTRADRVGADEGRSIACETVHNALYAAMITARHEPGSALTIRGIADDMAVSPMPVRQAVRRPVSVGAPILHSPWRVPVSNLTTASFSQVCSAGYLAEPALASCAIWRVRPEEINPMYLIDEELDQGIRDGDAQRDRYKYWEFRFTFDNASGARVIPGFAESLWLRFNPSMQRVVGRIGTSPVEDRHPEIPAALETMYDDALREAVRLGIHAGMEAIGFELFGTAARS